MRVKCDLEALFHKMDELESIQQHFLVLQLHNANLLYCIMILSYKKLVITDNIDEQSMRNVIYREMIILYELRGHFSDNRK